MNSFADTLKLLMEIDIFIQVGSTGDIIDFARQLGCTVPMLKVQLQRMNELGFKIDYDPIDNTYAYSEKHTYVMELGLKSNKPRFYKLRKYMGDYFGLKTLY